VDPSASETDPSNQNFKPSNRAELKSAMSVMLSSISDDDAHNFYDSMKDYVSSKEKDEEKMKKKKDSKVEESVRMTIRKMLKEAGPYRDTGLSYSGPMTGSSKQKGFEDCEACEGQGDLPDGTECKVCKGEGVVKSKAKRGYVGADVEAGMMTFDDMARELGYSGAPGARQAVERALEKARFAVTTDPTELQIITLTAMNDYIDFLKKSGELTPADVQLMKDHPNIISGLDGFREFLDGEMKSRIHMRESI
jgi:DnaJ-class molecular chaperone